MQADDSNMDGESDDDMDTKVNPMPADSQPTIGQGSFFRLTCCTDGCTRLL